MAGEKDTTTQAPVENAAEGGADDDFDSVFAELIGGDVDADTKTEAPAAAAVADDTTDTSDGEGTTADGAGAEADVEGADDSSSALDASVDVAPTVEDLTAQLAAANAKLAAKDTTEPPDTQEPPPKDETPTQSVAMYTPEEEAYLAEYRKEWPDVAKAEALTRRSEYNRLVAHIFEQVHKVYGPVMEQALRTTEQVSESSTLSAIRAAHNDYNDGMYDAVVTWANALPGFRKKVALDVISGGEVEDVIDLVTEWKQATGKGKPKVVVDVKPSATAAPAAPAAKKPAAPLTSKAKQAAAAMTARDTKRTAVGNDGPDMTDFDAAWGEATAAAK